MSRKHDEPTVSRHLEVYAADWEYLNTHFGRGSPTRLGTAVAIRQLIRKGVRAHQERVARRVEAAGAAGPPGLPGPSLDKFFAAPASQQEDDLT